jgi:hypothetical protein
MTIRVDVDRLPPDVAEALARGDTVELEQDGELIARVEPCERKVNWEAFFEARKDAPPLDYDDFLRDLEIIRQELNKPAEIRWPL